MMRTRRAMQQSSGVAGMGLRARSGVGRGAIAITAALGVLVPASGARAVPATVTQQGRLYDAEGSR